MGNEVLFCARTLRYFEENVLANHIHGKLPWRTVSKRMIPLHDTMHTQACPHVHAYKKWNN